MDFRVKKLILEEGMKNIAETEGVKLEMSFDSITKKITVDFHTPLQRYIGGVHKECSYDDIEDEAADIFKTIEDTRREVKDMKTPIAAVFRDGIRRNEVDEYIRNDIRQTAEIITIKSSNLPKIKKVIFNNPATIVLWADGDKTVVKCQSGDTFDAEKGLAMAIVKKAYGGKGNYCEVFKPWIEKYNKERKETLAAWSEGMRAAIHEVLGVPDVTDAVKDIQDILEGKVDPMMIAVDEEPNPEEKHCKNCKHEDKGCMNEPCHECLTAREEVTKWEPKE